MLTRIRDLLDYAAVLREYGELIIKPDSTSVYAIFTRKPSPSAQWPEMGAGLKLTQQPNYMLYMQPSDSTGLGENAVVIIRGTPYLITDSAFTSVGFVSFALRPAPATPLPDPASRWQ